MRRRHPPGLPLLTLASGCATDQADALTGQAPVADAIAALAGRADTLRFRAQPLTVAVHTPCTRRTGGRDPVFTLLAAVPRLQVVPLPDRGCCGAAGLHQVQFPDRADALRAPLLAAVRASGADRLLSANIGCRLHLAQAAGIPVQHPLEFLAECLP
jgi:glycolate oxidase iron-sulfur subunit